MFSEQRPVHLGHRGIRDDRVAWLSKKRGPGWQSLAGLGLASALRRGMDQSRTVVVRDASGQTVTGSRRLMSWSSSSRRFASRRIEVPDAAAFEFDAKLMVELEREVESLFAAEQADGRGPRAAGSDAAE